MKMRVVTAALIALACAVAMAGCDAVSEPSPRRLGVNFAVGSTSDGLVVVGDSGSPVPVVINNSDFSPDSVTAVAGGTEYVALLAGGTIYAVAADGTTTSAPCPVCRGLAALGDGFITAQRSFLPGVDFELVELDAGLQEASRSQVAFSPSRLEPSVTSRMRFPKVEATLPDGTVIVTYVSAAGGEAGNGRIYGPWIVAYYSTAGTLLRWLEGPGWNSIGPVRVSPDGRFSAIDGGSVSGACESSTWTELIDNSAAQPVALESSPALEDGEQRDDIIAGRWIGDQYINVRTTRPDSVDVCADLRTAWLEEIDPVDGSVTARKLGSGEITIGHLGQQCDRPITMNEDREFAVMGTRMPVITRIFFAPERQDCGG